MMQEIKRPGAEGAGLVRRGEASRAYGKEHPCWAGVGRPEAGSRGHCERPATMEVYGIQFCEVHGEEIACAALQEAYHGAGEELQRPLNPHVRHLSPLVAEILTGADEELTRAVWELVRPGEEALLRAFPLDRERVNTETLGYLEDPRSEENRACFPPYDEYMEDRQQTCRLMRLAFEDEAVWAVELLAPAREQAAEQAAYALALEREAGLRG